MTKVAIKPYLFEAAHTHIAHPYKGVAPPPPQYYLTSFTFQWLFKSLCLHLYDPDTDWHLIRSC